MQAAGGIPSGSGDDLKQFLESLTADGRAIVSDRAPDDADEFIRPLLERLDRHARNTLGLECPAYRPAVAHWAARLLYHLCQFVVCRDIDAARIQQACRTPCPEPREPSTDWSADLLLRYLPGVHRAAASLSPADPLVAEMKAIAAAWPLSSVGLPGLASALDLDRFVAHPALLRLYADRIAETGDQSRLGDPRIDERLRADLGLHRELAPVLAEALGRAEAKRGQAGVDPSKDATTSR